MGEMAKGTSGLDFRHLHRVMMTIPTIVWRAGVGYGITTSRDGAMPDSEACVPIHSTDCASVKISAPS